MARTILIVDDDRAMVDLLTEALTEFGYLVRVAYDGRMALDAIDRLFTDLVVTDIRMPHMDGLDLVHRLRARERPIPVLILTGAGERARLLDADVPVLAKPFDLDEVIRTIDRLLVRARRPS